jgi:hypothetical protein
VRLETSAAAAGRTRRDVLAEARAQLQALPPDEFPTLIRLADSIASDDAEAVFEFGLRLCVLAMESLGRAPGRLAKPFPATQSPSGGLSEKRGDGCPG